MATYTLITHNRKLTRTYWCLDDGGQVREVSVAHPGVLGLPVNHELGYGGDLMQANAQSLARLVRAARARERVIQQRRVAAIEQEQVEHEHGTHVHYEPGCGQCERERLQNR